MTYVVCFLLFGFVMGLSAVASNPSPYFAALGLVVVAGHGCGILLGHGGCFLSLVLFLIYLGGMLVVFAYSSALAAEPHPESWGSRGVVVYLLWYLFMVGVVVLLFQAGWYEYSWTPSDESGVFAMHQGDMSGMALMFTPGGLLLMISAWVLLLTLFVVLELTRGLARGTLRAV